MKRTREIVHVDGRTFREVHEDSGVGEFFDDLNQGIGTALTPIRIRGGFRVSTSWMIFGLIFCVNADYSPFFFILWMVSLFIKFE